MRRTTRIITSIAMLSGLGLCIGCAQPQRHIEPIVLGSPVLMFDRGSGYFAATDIGREDWPTTAGRLETLEETTFVESYHDHQGNAFQETSTPRRNFHAYRTGRSVR